MNLTLPCDCGERAALKRVLKEAEEVLLLSDPEGVRTKQIRDPAIDGIVLQLCKQHGFGAVMDSAARQWRNYPGLPPGGSHTTGACVSTVQNILTKIRAVLR